jgi:hypothetical protein
MASLYKLPCIFVVENNKCAPAQPAALRDRACSVKLPGFATGVPARSTSWPAVQLACAQLCAVENLKRILPRDGTQRSPQAPAVRATLAGLLLGDCFVECGVWPCTATRVGHRLGGSSASPLAQVGHRHEPPARDGAVLRRRGALHLQEGPRVWHAGRAGGRHGRAQGAAPEASGAVVRLVCLDPAGCASGWCPFYLHELWGLPPPPFLRGSGSVQARPTTLCRMTGRAAHLTGHGAGCRHPHTGLRAHRMRPACAVMAS